MKRIISLLAAIAIMAAMVAAMAAPAFAAANPHASCQGAAHSNQFPGPGAREIFTAI